MDSLKQQLEATYMTMDTSGNEVQKSVKRDTYIGMRDGFFANLIPNGENRGEHVKSPEHVISKLREKVNEYYR